MIVAKTVKGKGVSFMENNLKWHGSPPSEEEYEQAIAELDATLERLGS
jgi:transketolase